MSNERKEAWKAGKSKEEIDFIYFLSHWIYVELKTHGKITQTKIKETFDEWSSYALSGMRKLEKEQIIFSEDLHDPETGKTETVYLARKRVI